MTQHCGQKKKCGEYLRGLGPPAELEEPEEEPELGGCSSKQSSSTTAVCSDLTDLRVDDCVPEATMHRVKGAVGRWRDAAHKVSMSEIEKAAKQGPLSPEVVGDIFQKQLDFFKNLRSEKQEKAVLKESIDLLEPSHFKVGAQAHERVETINIHDWLQMIIRHDVVARKHIVEASDFWKTGAAAAEPKVINDLTQGSVFRESAFAQKATKAQRNHLRILLVRSYDGLELCKALGPKHGKHNEAMFYAAIGNLPTKMRFDHDYIAPICMLPEKVLGSAGAVRCIAGADAADNLISGEDSMGEQARALSDLVGGGVEIMVRTIGSTVCM